MLAPSSSHMGPRSLSIPSPQRFVTFSNFSHDRFFPAEKIFTFFFQNPLLPFGNSWFWLSLIFLEDSKLSIFPCVCTEAQHVVSLLINASVPCVFIIWQFWTCHFCLARMLSKFKMELYHWQLPSGRFMHKGSKAQYLTVWHTHTQLFTF